MSAETNKNLRKRMIDKAEDDGDDVSKKNLCSDKTETSVSDSDILSSSSSSPSQTSNDEQTTSDTAVLADVLIPFGPITDLQQFRSLADDLKRTFTTVFIFKSIHCLNCATNT